MTDEPLIYSQSTNNLHTSTQGFASSAYVLLITPVHHNILQDQNAGTRKVISTSWYTDVSRDDFHDRVLGEIIWIRVYAMTLRYIWHIFSQHYKILHMVHMSDPNTHKGQAFIPEVCLLYCHVCTVSYKP